MSRAPKTFRAFTVRSIGRLHRITTDVKVCHAFDPAAPPNPLPSYYETKGLWDTGATNSFVTKDTVAALGLISVGETDVNHAAGSSRVKTYMVNISLPNNVQVVGVRVAECESAPNDFGVIIGMDIITQGDFAVTNVNGASVVSYRMPSVSIIDYVQEANNIRYANVGPNNPCPCGKKNASGTPLKFKKCCGKSGGVN